MDHTGVLANQVDTIRADFSDCFFATGDGIIEARRKSNRELMGVITGIILGTILDNAGRLMDDNDITTGDILGRAGFGFVRLSFATPRLFALQSLELDCFDNTDPQFLLNNAFQEIASTCSSAMYRSYKARSASLLLQDSINCLYSTGSAVGVSKLRALSGLFTTLSLQQISA